MPRILVAELERIAKQNCWNNNRHTLVILRQLLHTSRYPGTIYALRRAIGIVKRA
jgi:hypothetical protein